METHSLEIETQSEAVQIAEAAGAISVERSVTFGDSLPPMPKPHIDEVDRNKGVNPVYGDHLPLGPVVYCGPLHDTYFS